MKRDVRTYAVTGATGNIGLQVTEILRKHEQTVRGIARTEELLKPLAEKGVEIYPGALEEGDVVMRAFDGADAVFSLIPPYYGADDIRRFQNRISEALCRAVAETGVRYVVNLSSVGAHLSEGGGPINGLHDHEENLKALTGVNVLNLRPCFFMENLLMQRPTIERTGSAMSPIRGDLALPMIATIDVADRAASRLLSLGFSGFATQELLGQRDLTMDEAFRVIGEALGRKEGIHHVHISYEAARSAMVEAGMSPHMAAMMIEMYRGLNEGRLVPTEARSAENTTGTSIEAFAEVVAAVFKAVPGT